MKLALYRLFREPLVHFIMLGTFIFYIYEMKSGGDNEVPNRIIVNTVQQKQLITQFNRTWLRAPTPEEMKTLIDNYVREEIFYREAVALGLDQQDAIVRKRMRMKLEFMLEDLSAQDVSDEELEVFLKTHPEKFHIGTQLSFQQVYLNPDKHKNIKSVAQTILTKLNDGINADLTGDNTTLPYEFILKTQNEIQRILGERFANEIIEYKPGKWTGPVYSVFGAHLIKVNERIEARVPDLAEVRDQVLRGYLIKKRDEYKARTYKRLREGYEVIVEPIAVDPVDKVMQTVQVKEAQ